MSGTLSGLRRRLVKVEQQRAERAERARRALLAKCNCTELTIALVPEKFEAEMNLRCPFHGFRRLGKIMRSCVKTGSRLDELVATYEARLAQAESEQAPEAPES